MTRASGPRVTRVRLLVLLAGTGALLTAAPWASASSVPPTARPAGPAAGEARALGLLVAAAEAARTRSYEGTQYVASWRASGATATVVDVWHSPGTGLHVSVPATADGDGGDAGTAVRTDALDRRLLPLLAAHYDLSVSAPQRSSGRAAEVVDARRPGVAGAPGLAGRFWLDRASGLVLRREVYDEQGRTVRSTAFLELDVAPQQRAAATAVAASLSGEVAATVDAGLLAALRADGWVAPDRLPRGMELFEAQLRDVGGAPVLHLAYSDGLSRLSLFSQAGRLGAGPVAGFDRREVGGTAVWMRASSPERVVWSGQERVWTLLSDAPPASVEAVVSALPHERPPRTGMLARLARGLARLASWLNPFS